MGIGPAATAHRGHWPGCYSCYSPQDILGYWSDCYSPQAGLGVLARLLQPTGGTGLAATAPMISWGGIGMAASGWPGGTGLAATAYKAYWPGF